MPRIKSILCSGICILYITALAAQPAPKNKSLSNVVGYQLYQQKQWNYNQLPKNSIQFKSDPKYIPLIDKKKSAMEFHLYPIKSPEVKKYFDTSSSSLYRGSNSYLQTSRFLKYQWQKQSWRTTILEPRW